MPVSFLPAAVSLALTLMLVALWLTVHRYPGIVNDAGIYALQALVRIHPALGADLYLQNGSQDNYTIFSPFYALTIRCLGLRTATLVLTSSFITCFLVAGWALARELYEKDVAWLAVVALILIPGAYGGAGVFHFNDGFLTARIPAQALIAAALVLQSRNMKMWAVSMAVAAFVIHPIMALPGILLLFFLWLPTRIALIATAAGIASVLAAALIAKAAPHADGLLGVMDQQWLEVVLERSHFLFLDHWTTADWKLNAQPFVSLTLTALVIPSTRRICVAAMLVGALGLAVALTASAVSPMAIVVQGQAWRWVWIPTFLCIVLLAPTAVELWRNRQCGPLCTVLLIIGWTYSSVDSLTCMSIALTLWLLRERIPDRGSLYLQWSAYLILLVIAIWITATSWNMIAGGSAESGLEPLLLARIRNIAKLDTFAVFATVGIWLWLRRVRSFAAVAAVSAAFLAASVYLAPKSFDQPKPTGSPALFAEFADWRAVIPATSTVFLADKFDAGTFVWFTLYRPNYLSISQSAGVVFSRATALEVKRRSEVVLPLEDEEWRLLQSFKGGDKGDKKEPKKDTGYRPLTAENLKSVCSDPQLGFVIAKENVGFDPVVHTHGGSWKNWNLYDCRTVRLKAPVA
jgi:hypothetical protein